MKTSFVLIALMFVSAVVQAQTPARFPAGSHELAVRGWFQGQEMEPWEAEYSVADTVVDGRTGLRIAYNSRRVGDKWAYRYTAAWHPDGGVAARWINQRPEPNSCELIASGGRISGKATHGDVAPIPFTGTAIPDFALGAYVATLPLEENGTVQLTVFRCVAGGGSSVVINQFNGVVRSGKARRGWGDWEPAWIVEGTKEYPARVTVAKSDRMVLHTLSVQGSVGHSEDSYVGSSRPRN